jgi:hypothetical protein
MSSAVRTVLAAAAIAAVIACAPPAHADPAPPAPIVPTPGGGSWLPSNQTYQPVCGMFPQACRFRYDPDTGTWQQRR